MARLAVVELQLIPGSLTDDTDLAAKLRAIDMDKVRYRGNRAETIKAWATFNASGMSAGTARGIHTYTDLDGTPIVVAASESAVNAWMNGTRTVITPAVWRDVWLDKSSAGADDSITITWIVYNPATDTGVEVPHGLAIGDVVTFSNVIGKAGLIGTFTINAVPTDTTFTVTPSFGVSGTPEAAFTCTVAWKNGLATGTGDTFATRARIPSIDNFGENAVFTFSDGSPLFMWQPETSTANKIVNGNFSSALTTGWDESVGWTLSSGTARSNTVGPNTLEQDVSQTLEQGKTYEMQFTVSGVTAASKLTTFRVMIDDVDIFPPFIPGGGAETGGTATNQTYRFRFTCPADPERLIFTAAASESSADATIAIDNISIAFLTTAFPISEAPYKNLACFVDGNRICSVLGSVEADGDFDPGLWRWCDQDNIREWVPNTDNVAGEFPLGKGNYAVCGAQVGERNLILSDAAAFAGSFTANGYSVRQIGTGCGAVGTRALAVYNNRAFWAGENAFYAYDGTQISVIECPNKDRYVGKLSLHQENKTFAWANIEYGEVWFHYAHSDDGTEVSRYQIFAFIEQSNPWSFGTFNRTCFAPASVYNKPIAIDTTGAIWTHETGTAMPGNIALPRLKTGYLVGQAGDRWVGCRRYYPDIENQVGNILFTVNGKRAPQGQNNTQSVGPLLLIPDENTLDFVISCRQIQFEWESEASPTSWRLGVVGLEMTADKERR